VLIHLDSRAVAMEVGIR